METAEPHGCFGTVANPIEMMTQEHEAAGTLLAEIKELSNDFTPPPDACPTYHAFFDGLKEFEQDLHQHIHLENNILFPRAIAMEASEHIIASGSSVAEEPTPYGQLTALPVHPRSLLRCRTFLPYARGA